MKKEKHPKLSDYEQRLAVVVIDELQRWESTTAITTGEFYKFIKRIAGIKRK